eukprot:TRINITY_DN38064_c0_g1_i1.p1 TRINITY_DN38064_c0_g1~~TRINITY_DN38064_c0_g1_i1.p1  ORF type:complete len:188 (+),score=28.24 TRINITY_DN38064_c0_g1_i1:250-813(+)
MEKPTNNSAPSTPCVSRSLVISNPTTFVQADSSTFREVVQKLTGASSSETPSSSSSSSLQGSHHVGPRRAAFKPLHERRQRIGHLRKLDLKAGFDYPLSVLSSLDQKKQTHSVGLVARSPVTPLVSDLFEHACSSPLCNAVHLSPSPEEEEERAIAEKRFYLHPSLLSPNGSHPRLLHLFPLHSDSA